VRLVRSFHHCLCLVDMQSAGLGSLRKVELYRDAVGGTYPVRCGLFADDAVALLKAFYGSGNAAGALVLSR
jgi:hypothetical protein